ncbi:unnamed protein product [Symbiodinium natans]|uniref:JmjC domain-containing protein n=1 Tax=Symbiodinium natans TaxID=878477 RepID=A0A812NEF9_9DINO|nr:unnamed protein product [Symbiodinium natans]
MSASDTGADMLTAHGGTIAANMVAAKCASSEKDRTDSTRGLTATFGTLEGGSSNQAVVSGAWTSGSTSVKMERRELLEEVLDCLADATHRGELREDGGVPGARPVQPRLQEFQEAAAGSSKLSKFLLSEDLGSEALARLSFAPPGWRMTNWNACFCGHILTIGMGAGATIYGEGSHALQNLHRDWLDTRLVDTCIAGCVGRKRIILLAPDEVKPRPGDSSRPALDVGWLRPLREMPSEEAWQAMEDHAQRSDVSGGAMDITPGMFIFIPHGWWHALRPLDDVTVISGPSKLSHHYHTEEVGFDRADTEELRKLACSLPAEQLALLQDELGDEYIAFLRCGTADLLQSLPIPEQHFLLDALQKVL